MPTLNDIALSLMGEMQEKTGDTGYQAQLVTWLIDAIVELSIKASFRMFWRTNTINTQINVSTYNLAADFREFKYLRRTDLDTPIQYINPNRLVEYKVDLEAKGPPRYAWVNEPTTDVNGNMVYKVVLNPTPQAIYAIDAPYFFHPVNLTASSAIPISVEGLLVVKNKVRINMYKMDKDWDAVADERKTYAENLDALLSREKSAVAKRLVAQTTDLPRNTGRPKRLRYPYE